MSKDQKRKKSDHAGERIAKVMARVGLCSRRDAEAWIVNGRVSVNGKVLSSAAINVDTKDIILVDGKPLPEKQLSRVWLYYKPKGLMTTSYDPEGRATVFDNLPADMPRVISIGRLDLNSEGLLLLTNDGELARKLELPTTAWIRHYRVRVNGRFDPQLLDGLKNGIEVDGVRYGPIIASFDRQQGANAWLNMALTEGKNREIRRICQHFGWPVSRLIRIGYGPFRLGEMEPGQVQEVKGKQLKEQLQFGNDYRHSEKADPEKLAQEAENRRGNRRERPVFDKGPDKRTRDRNRSPEERAERQVRDEVKEPRRNQRPGRNERMARAEGTPPRFDKPVRADKPGRPEFDRRPGNRPEKFARPARPARDETEDRTERPQRAEHARIEHVRGDKPSWADRPRRDETTGGKPSWSKRPDRDERPESRDRPEKAERAGRREREGRPEYTERPRRSEQPVRSARPERETSEKDGAPKRGLKPGWAKNKPTKPQPGTGRKPERDRPTKADRYGRSDAPARDSAAHAEKPRAERPRADKPRSDKPWGDKPRVDKAWGDKPRGDNPRGGKPHGARPHGGRSQGDRPRGDKPVGDKPRGKPGSGNARRFR